MSCSNCYSLNIMKTCIRCGATFPLDHFYSDKSKKDGKTPYCRDCRRDKAKIQNDKDPDKARVRARARRNQDRLAYDVSRMGLTKEQYFVMLEKQGGVCAVCKEEETMLMPSGEIRRLSIDHDHSCCPKKRDICGRCNRGLLCNRCNRTLGMVDDNIELLRNAVAYLEGFNK